MGDNMQEQWRRIPGYDAYDVSDQGRVRSYYKAVGKPDWWIISDTPQRVLSPGIHSGGYRQVNLHNADGGTIQYVSHLVLLTFIGSCPDGLEVCHNNGDKTDDRLENLRYDTHLSNVADITQSTWEKGRLKASGLTEADVVQLRCERAEGTDPVTLSKKYDMCIATISNICRGDVYKRIPGPRTTAWRHLNPEQVVAIRNARSSGSSLADLSQKYGVSCAAISRICNGRTHKYAAGPLTEPGQIVVR